VETKLVVQAASTAAGHQMVLVPESFFALVFTKKTPVTGW
jgi:hypothetical protein